MRYYFDTSATIYFVENIHPWKPLIQARLSGGNRAVFSDLTRMESRIKPLKMNDLIQLAEYERFFHSAEFVPLSTSVFDRAAQIRADYGFKTPDAIHLAAAVEAMCDQFLTNDQRLSRFSDIPIDVI